MASRDEKATLLAAQGSALANAAFIVSAEYDNRGGVNEYADISFNSIVYASTSGITAGAQVLDVWVVPADDSGNYPTGHDGATDPADVWSVPVPPTTVAPSTSVAERISAGRVALPPARFKVVIKNVCGQQINSGYSVTMQTYGR
jgi:hypothetical protein